MLQPDLFDSCGATGLRPGPEPEEPEEPENPQVVQLLGGERREGGRLKEEKKEEKETES